MKEFQELHHGGLQSFSHSILQLEGDCKSGLQAVRDTLKGQLVEARRDQETAFQTSLEEVRRPRSNAEEAAKALMWQACEGRRRLEAVVRAAGQVLGSMDERIREVQSSGSAAVSASFLPGAAEAPSQAPPCPTAPLPGPAYVM